MLNPIRLSKENEAAIERLVRESDNILLTPPLAVNAAVKEGLPAAYKLFVKNGKAPGAGRKAHLKP